MNQSRTQPENRQLRSQRMCYPVENPAAGHRIESTRDNEDIVAMLIKYKADISTRTRDGNTPLILAADSGKSGIVNQLIKSGADVNARSNNGNTALMLAAANNHVDTVKILLQADAKTGIRNGKHEQARDLAEASGSTESLAILEQDSTSAAWLPDWL